MEHYNLREDEVVLYKGNVTMLDKQQPTQLLLTNLNFVFITKNADEESVETVIFPIEEVKIYEGIPQIKSKDSFVEIYFKTTEKEFAFESKSELHKFVSAATNLLTGKSGAERNAEKVKGAIGLVNDTLGVDIVKATGDVIKNGVGGAIDRLAGSLAKSLFGKKK